MMSLETQEVSWVISRLMSLQVLESLLHSYCSTVSMPAFEKAKKKSTEWIHSLIPDCVLYVTHLSLCSVSSLSLFCFCSKPRSDCSSFLFPFLDKKSEETLFNCNRVTKGQTWDSLVSQPKHQDEVKEEKRKREKEKGRRKVVSR